jgi:hypothetical protein
MIVIELQADENEGEELLHRVNHGKYRSEGYVYHARLQGAMIVLVTEQRLLLLQGNCVTTGTTKTHRIIVYEL